MAYVEMVGMNTIVIPLIIPLVESGSVVFKNTVALFAPRSCAASATPTFVTNATA